MSREQLISIPVKRKIEARFGKPIRYSKDCETLAMSIERACRQKISATTLKRLLGFAKTVERPRLYTLDVLAEYVGYPDWSSLLTDTDKVERNPATATKAGKDTAAEPTGDIYDLSHQLIISLTTQQIDTGKIIQLCRQYGKKPEIIPFINELIHLAGRLKNLQFLKEIFQLPNLFDEKLHTQGDIFYIGQTIGMLLRANPDICYELVEAYAANKNARKYLVEWFVDEDYLLGYYGELLDLYHRYKKKNVQDRVFYFALKYSQAALAGDVLQQKEWFRKLDRLKISGTLHPIPAGRYAGISITESANPAFSASSPLFSIVKQYVVPATYENTVCFLLYLYRYLFKGQRPEWMKGVLRLYLESVEPRPIKEKSHWGLRMENELSIYLAYAHYLDGNKREAKKLIGKVDPGLFEAFMYKQIHNDYTSIAALLLK